MYEKNNLTFAWELSSSITLSSYGSMGEMIAFNVAIGSFAVGLLHIALLHPRGLRRSNGDRSDVRVSRAVM